MKKPSPAMIGKNGKVGSDIVNTEENLNGMWGQGRESDEEGNKCCGPWS